MFKKFICMLVILSLALFSSIPSFAQSSGVSFSRDTLITKDNINSILKHYGLDPKTALKRTSEAAYNTEVTVGQLEDAINAFSQQQNNITIRDGISRQSKLSVLDNPPNFYGWAGEPSYYWVPLSNTVDLTGYSIRESLNAEYRSRLYYTNAAHTTTATLKYWYDYENTDVELISNSAPTVGFMYYKLESINFLDGSFTQTTMTITSDITVGTYFVISIGEFDIIEVLLGTNDIESYSSWGSSYMN